MKAWVYVFDTDRATKVGITTREPQQRARDLVWAAGLVVRIVRVWPFDSRKEAYEVEQAALALLDDDRLEGEWVSSHPLTACDAVEKAISLGVASGDLAASSAAEPITAVDVSARRRGRPRSDRIDTLSRVKDYLEGSPTASGARVARDLRIRKVEALRIVAILQPERAA